MSLLAGIRGRVFTAVEYLALVHPPCPGCGVSVLLKASSTGRVDGADRWMVTGWTCPRGCGSG